MGIRLVKGAAPKVGYVLKRFPRLAETFILNEILELERQGVQVEIFSLLRPPPEERHALLGSLRAPVTYLPNRGVLDSWQLRTENRDGNLQKSNIAARLSESERPLDSLFPGKDYKEALHLCLQGTTVAMLASARGLQHLHAHFGSNATTVALLASRISRIPYSFTAHARDIYHTYVDPDTDDALRRRKIAESRFVVTVSDYNRRYLIKLAGDDVSSKIHRLYNGINLGHFAPCDERREAGLFLAVGRLIEKKGFRYLVEACRLLKSHGLQFRCVIVGRGPDKDRLQRQIAAAGLDSTVELRDAMPQERLLELMQQASAVVLPCVVSASGDRDGLPTVLLEGLAMGLPAISTMITGVPEIIEHERTGLLAPPENPKELAYAMEQILLEPQLGRRMGAEGRLKAEREFDLCKNVAVLRDYFARSAAADTSKWQDTPNEDRVRHSG